MSHLNDMNLQGRIPLNRLEKLFQQHGNEFVKWNFLPFLTFEERKKLRTSCKIFRRFIPPPKFVYFKTLALIHPMCATARLEKNTGHVETRGNEENGGNSESVAKDLQSNVIQIFATIEAFAALKKNGKVVTWGSDTNGGDSSSVTSELQSDIVHVFSTRYAFAALNKQGKVICWGDSIFGGNSSSVCSDLQSDVVRIASTEFAFAALNKRGKVICQGGTRVASDLESDVTHVVANQTAFAALKSNGKVVCWGDPNNGSNSSQLASLNHDVSKLEVTHHTFGFGFGFRITEKRFRATKNDGTIVEWP